MRTATRRRRGARGYMLSELLAVVSILGLLLTMAGIDAARVMGRARNVAALTSVCQVFATGRLEAIKRGQRVVVEISVQSPGEQVTLRMFEDRNPDFVLGTFTVPPASTAKAETILRDIVVDDALHVWKHGTARDDLAAGALFNGYNGDQTLGQRIIFLSDGGIVAPSDSASGTPTPSGGRGLYLADATGTSFFRVSFPTALVASPHVDKWAGPSVGYVDSGWSW